MTLLALTIIASMPSLDKLKAKDICQDIQVDREDLMAVPYNKEIIVFKLIAYFLPATYIDSILQIQGGSS